MLDGCIDWSSVKKVLVVKLRHHGDVLLTTPVFSSLVEKNPKIKVDALIYSETEPMLSCNPYIDRIYLVDRGWKHLSIIKQLECELKLIRQLKQRHYDLVVHLTEHWRGAWLVWLLGRPLAVSAQYTRRRHWFWKKAFPFCYPITHQRHQVELHLDALRYLGLHPTSLQRRLVLVVPNDAKQDVRKFLAAASLESGYFVLLHPGARWLFKSWSITGYVQLIQQLQKNGIPVVVSAGPGKLELDLISAITAQVTPNLNLAGQLNLKQLAALIAECRCFVGVDSAPMHMAAALNKPLVALFGPSGDTQWGPWSSDARVIRNLKLACQPCGMAGCVNSKRSDCLQQQPLEPVLDAVMQHWNRIV